jgi:hypothetical protein
MGENTHKELSLKAFATTISKRRRAPYWFWGAR